MSAAASQAGAQDLDVPAEASASRWSSSVMERHMPVDPVQLQKLGQKKFRYMDMAQAKRSKSIRNAVIVRGAAGEGAAKPGRKDESLQPQNYRDHAEPGHPIVIMRPMT
jgi:hypothetical protein